MLTAADLRLQLALAGMTAPAFIADAAYLLPRADWLLGEFEKYYRASLHALVGSDWSAERWDCDDFADLYAILARICHRRTPGSERTGLAVGSLWYTRPGVGGHAINVALTSDKGLIFIEPQQPANQISLSATDRSTAWHVRF